MRREHDSATEVAVRQKVAGGYFFTLERSERAPKGRVAGCDEYSVPRIPFRNKLADLRNGIELKFTRTLFQPISFGHVQQILSAKFGAPPSEMNREKSGEKFRFLKNIPSLEEEWRLSIHL